MAIDLFTGQDMVPEKTGSKTPIDLLTGEPIIDKNIVVNNVSNRIKTNSLGIKEPYTKDDAMTDMVLGTIGGTLKTIGSSASKLAKGLIHPILPNEDALKKVQFKEALNPIKSAISRTNLPETVSNIGKTLLGTFEKLVPGKQVDEKYFDVIADVYKDRYGSIDGIADTVAKDPFGFVLDVATLGSLVSGGLKTAGKIAGSKGISAAGDLGGIAKSTMKKIDKTKNVNLENATFKQYNKIFNPKMKSGQTLSKLKKDSIGRLQAIDSNIPENGLFNPYSGETFTTPKNSYEHLIAATESKKKIWNNVNKLLEGADSEGATINVYELAKKAKNELEKDYGHIARNTDLKNIMNKVDNKIEGLKELGDVTPTQAQEYLSTMTKQVVKRNEKNVIVDNSLDDFNTKLYSNIVDKTDSVIDKVLANNGYKKFRKDYALIKAGEKTDLTAANKWLSKEGGRGGGVAHPMVNLFSVEAIVSGMMKGNPVGGLANAAKFQITKKVLDFLTNSDRGMVDMYNNVRKLPIPENIRTVTPEILWNEIPISKRKALPAPKPNFKRLIDETSGEVIIPENPVKRLGYDPSVGIRKGKVISGGKQGLTGGFGQFIVRDK